jgi:alkaline phosphatase
VSWSTTGHTGVNVPIYAMGPGADRVTGIMENTEIHSLLLQGLD